LIRLTSPTQTEALNKHLATENKETKQHYFIPLQIKKDHRFNHIETQAKEFEDTQPNKSYFKNQVLGNSYGLFPINIDGLKNHKLHEAINFVLLARRLNRLSIREKLSVRSTYEEAITARAAQTLNCFEDLMVVEIALADSQNFEETPHITTDDIISICFVSKSDMPAYSASYYDPSLQKVIKQFYGCDPIQPDEGVKKYNVPVAVDLNFADCIDHINRAKSFLCQFHSEHMSTHLLDICNQYISTKTFMFFDMPQHSLASNVLALCKHINTAYKDDDALRCLALTRLTQAFILILQERKDDGALLTPLTQQDFTADDLDELLAMQNNDMLELIKNYLLDDTFYRNYQYKNVKLHDYYKQVLDHTSARQALSETTTTTTTTTTIANAEHKEKKRIYIPVSVVGEEEYYSDIDNYFNLFKQFSPYHFRDKIDQLFPIKSNKIENHNLNEAINFSFLVSHINHRKHEKRVGFSDEEAWRIANSPSSGVTMIVEAEVDESSLHAIQLYYYLGETSSIALTDIISIRFIVVPHSVGKITPLEEKIMSFGHTHQSVAIHLSPSDHEAYVDHANWLLSLLRRNRLVMLCTEYSQQKREILFVETERTHSNLARNIINLCESISHYKKDRAFFCSAITQLILAFKTILLERKSKQLLQSVNDCDYHLDKAEDPRESAMLENIMAYLLADPDSEENDKCSEFVASLFLTWQGISSEYKEEQDYKPNKITEIDDDFHHGL